ncbi:hypothetical protein SAMN05421677_12217 [Halobacillus aidingensis]|uniref:UPF0178 protein SAMN05421677_12217 n=2 Tax=Halobacillus TaxID=45667 RepID=A0A1H0TN76_HALAD|nr:hypothetical protein SAMN05421677_12217 [Halobacillus aidingensis]
MSIPTKFFCKESEKAHTFQKNKTFTFKEDSTAYCRNIDTMPNLNVHIYVDADSCPVQEEIIDVCMQYDLHPYFIATVNHYSREKAEAGWMFVDDGSQSVDLYILNQVGEGDVVITQDLSLAVLLTSKGVYVLTPRGKLVRENDADNIMNQKFIRQQTMKQRKKWKGPSAFTANDREKFRSVFQKLLSEHEGF